MALRTSENLRAVDRHHRKKTTERKKYDALDAIFADLAELLRPPERITVTEAAEKYVKLNNQGSYIGPYKRDMAPYMVEPQDTCASRLHTGCIFVGPAQCGKTESLVLNLLTYSVVVDPMDMILYCPTLAAARDFSVRRVDRLHRNSPDVGSVMLRNRDSDNKFDKHYRTGMIFNMSWPSVTEFAGRPIGRVTITDYDRIPDDIDGDGNAYDLASKRTTSFKSFAMTLAESSPSRPITNLRWIRTSPHEAPPCTGILGLYNRGDRRRWYWPCPHCERYFEGRFTHLVWDTKETIMESAQSVRMVCPNCGGAIEQTDRHNMQQWGVWLRDGQSIDEQGRIVGKAVTSYIASFWLFGVAAAFTSWTQLVVSYLNAVQQFEKTGSEEELKKFYNTDLAEPYVPKQAEVQRLPEVMKARAEKLPVQELDVAERIERGTSTNRLIRPLVPHDVRFLVAAVDVQKNMFVVQVHGICPGNPFDVVVVDRFSIRKSRRQDEQGEHLWVKPGSYLEDWSEVTSEVIKRTYDLSDGSGRKMMVRYTVCDSGGEAGVTTNAYNYYRKLRQDGNDKRFHLVKGDPLISRPRTQIVFPDSNKRDKLSAARGDVPVMLINSNVMKDSLVNRLESDVPGAGMFRYPDWLPDWWFAEMCAEIRTDKGWEAAGYHRRNEGFDCSYYALAACVSVMLRAEGIDWKRPPGWAERWDENSLVISAKATEAFANPKELVYDFSKLGKSLASEKTSGE